MVVKDLSTTEKDILVLFSKHYKITVAREVPMEGDYAPVSILIEDMRNGAEQRHTLGSP